jgi:hypothetical protein
MAKGLTVPVMPGYAMGRDGDETALAIQNGHNQATFRWWCERPDAWTEVDQFARAVVAVVQERCPGIEGPRSS